LDELALRTLLAQLERHEVTVEAALERLRDLPYEDLGYAKVDHHRALRTGFPEVIYCAGKTVEQLLGISESLLARGSKVLGTRTTPEQADALLARFPGTYHSVARIVSLVADEQHPQDIAASPRLGTVLVVAAGTSDLPVAEEAVVTASEMGSPVDRLYDVGVAGLHRLLDRRETLFSARVVIVVAGMEGALASVVGGLVKQPVIAVPTSVGYGASFQGLAALLTMLNSCASGVSVMNIDNGFGAGYFAHLVNAM
jgi:NCAIR mutase (PurE)-related protein